MKSNEGYVVALDGYIKWSNKINIESHLDTFYMDYRPNQQIGISNPMYTNFLSTDYYSATQLRFAEIFSDERDAEKLITFLESNPEILTDKCLFRKHPDNADVNLRVKKISINIID
jgi:hypothetical protein